MAEINEKDKNKRSRILLLLLLLLLVSITSCIVGYIIGQRSGVQNGGQIVDNIILTPTKPQNGNLSFSGVVRYSDGTPAANTTVELHSSPLTAVTDEKGHFFFHLAQSGEHTLYVLNGQGAEIASCRIGILADESCETVKLSRDGENGYTVEIPVDVLLVEIEVVLAEDEKGSPEIRAVAAIQTDGTVVTGDSRTRPEENRTITTDKDNTVFDDGTILLNDNRVLLNDGTLVVLGGTVTHPSGEEETPVEVLWTKNSAAVIPEGTVLTPGGHVITNKGDVIHPDGEIVLADGTGIPAGSDEITLSDGTIVNAGKITLPSGTEIDQDKKTVTVSGKVTVSSEEKVWIQNTIVNLFAGIKKLYPGMKGSYTFQVSNTRRETVAFSMTVKDDHENAIPFVLTLKDANGNVVSADSVTVEAKSSMTYTLCWEWPYESGNDELDTDIGTSDELSHTVTITIRAEAVG